VAAYVLNTELLDFFTFPETVDPRKLRRITEDITRWQIKLADRETIQLAVGNRIFEEINKIDLDISSLQRVNWLNEVIGILEEKTDLKPETWRSQNVFYLLTKGYRKGLWVFANKEWQAAFERLAMLLGVKLK
jgi:hypothetical protein